METQTASSTPLNRANRWEVRPQLNDNSDQPDGSTDVRRGEDGGASCWDINVLNIALKRSSFSFYFIRISSGETKIYRNCGEFLLIFVCVCLPSEINTVLVVLVTRRMRCNCCIKTRPGDK